MGFYQKRKEPISKAELLVQFNARVSNTILIDELEPIVQMLIVQNIITISWGINKLKDAELENKTKLILYCKVGILKHQKWGGQCICEDIWKF